MSRLRIAGLIDLVSVTSPAAIAQIASDPRMDRRYEVRGPLVNRLVWRRLASILSHEGKLLPTIAPREDPERGRRQRESEEMLSERARRLDPAAVRRLADYVRGGGPRSDAGRLAQQAIGRLFVPGYRATPASWAAAELLEAGASSFNPLRRLYWALTGRVGKARALLAAMVAGDRTALHATGIAVHNLAESLANMRDLCGDPALRARLSSHAAVARALVAPAQILRQPEEAGETAGGLRFGRDSLVRLRLRAARARDPGAGPTFMSGSWSACPARDWVPALLAAVWRQAAKEGGDAL